MREPEVPVSVRLLLPVAAAEDAVSVMFCEVPGVSVNVDGLAVTPVGSPAIVAETVPVKEFRAVALTLTVAPVAPATMLSEEGAMESEKSGVGGAAETARATLVEWLNVPEVPVSVRLLLPVGAVEDAVSVTFCETPGVSVNVDGLAVTPVGSPVIATETLPVKEFNAVARTLI